MTKIRKKKIKGKHFHVSFIFQNNRNQNLTACSSSNSDPLERKSLDEISIIQE